MKPEVAVSVADSVSVCFFVVFFFFEQDAYGYTYWWTSFTVTRSANIKMAFDGSTGFLLIKCLIFKSYA